MITLVVSADQLRSDEVQVDGPAYRHLFRARRLTGTAEIRLVDGQGSARFARAVAVDASSGRLALGAAAPDNEPARYVELLAPVPKASRLSWMVEKATEIGVSGVRLIQTQRAPRTIGVGTLERLRRVAVAAVEQSHRSVVPVVSGVHAFSELPDLMDSIPDRSFLQPRSAPVKRVPAESAALLLVGPEGGWAPDEVERLTEWGCWPMGLGPTVMRIETAAVVGCAGLLIGSLFE